MKREKHIEILDREISEAMDLASHVSSGLSELQGCAEAIIHELFASRGLKITYQQAEIFVDRVGAGHMYPAFPVLQKVAQLKKCSRAQLQNWIDLGKDAVIKFFD
jgi:hypothetical protein